MALAESAYRGHFAALMTKEIFGLKAVPRVLSKIDNKSFEEHLRAQR